MITFALNLRRKIGNWLNNGNSIVRLGGFSGSLLKVKSIIIVTQVLDDKHNECISILKQALKDLCPFAQISILCHHPKVNTQDSTQGWFESSDETEYFTDDSLSFFFKIKNRSLRDLLKREYDLSIAYYLGENISLDYIVPYVKSKLKIGTSEHQKANLIIKPNESSGEADYCKHLIECIKMFFGS